MAGAMSRTQIDRLGDRLRKGHITEADLRLLDEYRRTFTPAYEVIIGRIRKDLGLEPTGRPAKSTTSISDKLRRESIRLTQIQDIAGCRLIVADIAEQDRVVQSLTGLFEHTTVSDRRQQPSHGYRAVHVLVRYEDKLIEIQVRTALQHLWAELSEKFADVEDPMVKYGGGREETRAILTRFSSLVANHELVETQLANAYAQLPFQDGLSAEVKQGFANIEEKLSSTQEMLSSHKHQISELLRKAIDSVENQKGDNNAIPD